MSAQRPRCTNHCLFVCLFQQQHAYSGAVVDSLESVHIPLDDAAGAFGVFAPPVCVQLCTARATGTAHPRRAVAPQPRTQPGAHYRWCGLRHEGRWLWRPRGGGRWSVVRGDSQSQSQSLYTLYSCAVRGPSSCTRSMTATLHLLLLVAMSANVGCCVVRSRRGLGRGRWCIQYLRGRGIRLR